eukprot:4105793-Pleurochrysis_carterae.AAC.1
MRAKYKINTSTHKQKARGIVHPGACALGKQSLATEHEACGLHTLARYAPTSGLYCLQTLCGNAIPVLSWLKLNSVRCTLLRIAAPAPEE